MASVPLKLIPTVNAEATETLNEAGISSCNLIRFKSKLPQKLGGWEKFYPSAIGGGTARDLHAWQDLSANDWLAYAATSNITAITGGVGSNITPQTKTTNPNESFDTTISTPNVIVDDSNISNVTDYDSILFMTPVSVGGIILNGLYAIDAAVTATSYTITAADNATSTVTNGGAVPSFATVNGSAIVTVTLAAHGLSVDDDFTFLVSTTVGGVTIFGTYPVLSVPTANSFTISTLNTATSTTSGSMNGGVARILYFITLGPPGLGSGYGTGTYGTGGYGIGSTGTSQTGTDITVTDWTLDNWGENLLACYDDGQIFEWTPNSGFQNMSLVEAAPVFNGGIFVSMPAQILVAWGSSNFLQRDPLLVRWSDQEDYYTWTGTTSNQAGSFRLSSGSKIVGAIQAPQQSLLWTDIDVWSMSYIGPPLVFSFNKVGSGCGLIGAHAAAIMRGVVFWMSPGNFFVMSGSGVQVLPCSVWDVVFQDLNTTYQHKCVAAANSTFDEIWFFYPSLSNAATECDSYVKFNLQEQSWDYGSMQRSAWIDQSVLGQPIGATSGGIIYQHETSTDADGQPLNWWFETGYFVVAEGQNMAVIDQLWPDFKYGPYGGDQDATVLVTITVVDYPGGTERSYGPFPVTAASTYVSCRCRGRQVKLRFEGNDAGTFVRLGLMRLRTAPDGRR